MTSDEFDPYRTLGVDRTASLSEIRRAYRRLALACHPDKAPSESPLAGRPAAADPMAEAADSAPMAVSFEAISRAYDLVGSEHARRIYDELLAGEQMRLEGSISFSVLYRDLSFEPADDGSDSAEFSVPCRCGGAFRGTAGELSQGFNVFGCDQCSQCIEIVKER